MAKAAEAFLHIGDEIFLYDENGNILFAENPLETHACTRPSLVDRHSSESIGACIFRVEPQQSHTEKKALEEFMGDETLDSIICNGTGETLHELETLQALVAKESSQNEAEKRRLVGKPVLFGQIIQLYNGHFRKYLTVTGQTCKTDKSRLQVDLSSSAVGFFKILPRYRIRVDGEPIRLGDTITIQGIHPEGFLNVNTKPLRSYTCATDYYEVYSHTRTSSWTMKLHHHYTATNPETEKTKMINSGQYLRFYHKEMEAYMEADASNSGSGDVRLRKHIINPLDPKESDSPLAFWEIENANISAGSRIRWKKPVRIRHASSRSYLYIDSNDVRIDLNSNKKMTFKMGLIKEPPVCNDNNDLTLFTLVPALEPTSSGIPFGSYVRVRHMITQCWIHSAADRESEIFRPEPPSDSTLSLPSQPFAIPIHDGLHIQLPEPFEEHYQSESPVDITQQTDSSSHMTDTYASGQVSSVQSVTASQDLYYHDCFSITLVDDDLADTFNTVNELFPRLQQFLRQERNTELAQTAPFLVPDSEFDTIAGVLKELIVFCTKSNETDPAKRVGLPIEYHQGLLRDIGIVETVIQMTQVPFYFKSRVLSDSTPIKRGKIDSKKVLALDILQGNQGRNLKEILTLCYNLLRVFLVGGFIHEDPHERKRNQIHILTKAGDEGVRVFIEHLAYDVGATGMLINLVQDNDFVVESILDTAPDMLTTLIHMVQENAPRSTQLEMNKELTHYVRLLGALCLVETANNNLLRSTGEFVFKILIHNARLLQTRMRSENSAVHISILGGEWYELDALFHELPHLIPFVESLLSLFQAISQGANSKTRAILYNYIERDVCLKCLGNIRLPSQIRAKFCEILTVLYINQPDHSEVVLSDFTLQYAWLDESNTYPCGGTGDVESQRPEFFDLLRRWLFVFLDDIRHQFAEEKENIEFLSAVLRLIYTQLRLGFFVAASDVKTLFRLLVHVLDGQTDARNKEHAKFLSANEVKWAERFILTEENQRVMNTKIQILDIFDLAFNLRLHVRMKKLAAAWKEMETNMTAGSHLTLRDTLTAIFEETMLREREQSLMPILKDILHYQYTPLKHIAVVIMHRLYKDCEDLFNKAPQVLIISHPHQILVYYTIRKRLMWLQSFFSVDKLTMENLPDILKMLQEFIALFDGQTYDINGTICLLDMDDQRGIYSKIFKNLNVHASIMQLLTAIQGVMRHTTSKLDEANSRCIDLMKYCLEFLYELVKDDTELQGTFVLDNLDLLIDTSAHHPKLALGVYNVCKDNVHISLRVHEEHIRCILELSNGKHGEYFHLLLDFMKVGGKLIKKNQYTVTHLVMDNQNLYIPFNTPTELVLSTRMSYCLQLTELLSVCAQGDNTFGQSFARTIFSIQDIAFVIHHPESSLELRTKMLRFLSSVYLDNIDVPSHVPVSENQDIRQLMETAMNDMQQAKESLTEENTDYIYHGILVFLRAVFEYHISLETTVDKSLFSLCPKLVDLAVDLLDAAKDDLKLIQSTVACLDSMINVSGFRGNTAPELLRDKLRDAMVQVTDGTNTTYQPPDTLNAKFQGFIRALQVYKGVIILQAEEFGQLVSHFNLVDVSSEKNVKSLIDYLSMMATTTYSHQKSEHYQVATIQLLERIPLHSAHRRSQLDSPNTKHQEALQVKKLYVQNTLNRLGCTLVAQNLLSSPHRLIFEAALKLLIALLEDGNKNVQDKLEEYFYSIREERFFYSFHQRLQNGIVSLEEARTHLLHASYKLNRQQRILSIESIDNSAKNNIIAPYHRRFSPSKDMSKGRKRTKSHSQKTKEESAILYQKISNLMASDTAEFGTANADFEGMKNTMRAIQLMVEGHNMSLQTYLAKQPDNIKSFNIVQDVVGYLHAIVPLCNIQNVRLIIQVLDTITELAQGCPENQVTIFNGKIINPVNAILREPYPNCPGPLINELKSKVVTCLLSLLEGGIHNSETVFRDMATSIDLSTVMENMTAIYEANAKYLESQNAFQKLECGFLYCMLVMTLSPAFDEVQHRTIDKVKSFEYFQGNTGKIEIVMEYGAEKQLSRVLFPIPEICKQLPENTKQSFLWNVKRDSPSAKIEDFVQQTGNIIYEIENQARVAQNVYLSFLTEHSSFWWKASYTTTILLNMLMIRYPSMLVAEREIVYANLISFGYMIRLLFGLLHLILWVFSATEFCFIELPILVNRKIVKTAEKPLDFLRKPDDNAFDNSFSLFEGYYSHKHFNLNFISACITEPQFVYHAVMVGLSVIGLRYPGFYALHLLDFVFRDRILQGVISSITLNVNSITRTALLGIIVVYIHSVVAFKYFSKEFDESKGLLCKSLSECFITVLSHGVRSGGGIGDILEPPDHLEEVRGWRIMFEMSFYLVVVVFLLNAIFGIIFDTFGHLRDERSLVQQDMKSSCFICSIPAVEFQRHAKKGFEDHINNDHNIWQYLFFFVHLRNKDQTEYTGPESYVAACLKDANYGFFPINRTLCLHQNDSDDVERLEKLEELAANLLKKLNKIETHMERMTDGQARSRSNSILRSPI